MTKPNIVWLTSDHMLYAHHKRLTGYPQLKTYDRICNEGIEFNNAFSVTPLCQPCRASLLTGVYPHRHRMILNDGQAGAKLDFAPDEALFNRPLEQAGYRVGYFGKWHTGEERIAKDYGFEGFSCPGYGHPYWTDEYDDYLTEQELPQPEVEIERWVGFPEWTGRSIRLVDFPKPYASPYFLMESSGILKSPVETHEAYFLAHLANRWLEDAASSDQPFCLRVDPWGPHHPFWVAEPFLNTVDPASIPPYPSFGNDLSHRPQNHRDLLKYRQEYANHPEWSDWQWFITRAHEHAHLVDAALGRILDKLDELGLTDNTIVIYTVDHGGALGSNGQLVDKGWIMTEETVRIPLGVRWPEKIATGQNTDKFVMNMDIVPTVLEAAKATIPDPCDGHSLLGLCQNPTNTSWRDDLMLEHHGHYDEIYLQRQLRYGHYKYTAHLNDRHELYDLKTDPFELDNLIDNPDYAELLKEMSERLRQQMENHKDDASEAQALLTQLP